MKIQQINSQINNPSHKNKTQSIAFEKAIKLPYNAQVKDFILNFAHKKDVDFIIGAGREANINFHSKKIFDVTKEELKKLNLWENSIVHNKNKLTKHEFEKYSNVVIF